jgi:hypothetical protein
MVEGVWDVAIMVLEQLPRIEKERDPLNQSCRLGVMTKTPRAVFCSRTRSGLQAEHGAPHQAREDVGAIAGA